MNGDVVHDLRSRAPPTLDRIDLATAMLPEERQPGELLGVLSDEKCVMS